MICELDYSVPCKFEDSNSGHAPFDEVHDL